MKSVLGTCGVSNSGMFSNSTRQRQLMCNDCEKSLPNQIVFDKIESIIWQMQDENNGLPVKTAKSFMSKIPSVFTGTDLIQWMMRNLQLDDQQEAVHLANLIASHGYIFPIEDHALTIKNDCTFYRFQTPCLWPSHNADPENLEYAVYLCKRTMQGKTRLELADYEAENLARLQKTYSRKWELIFMQAESQAKVDKKRDKLERKVLDSQERAFWDVYRPVPGCVNTTELDIKKACRLSKSAKRCAECQKVGTPATSNMPAPSLQTAASSAVSQSDVRKSSAPITHASSQAPPARLGEPEVAPQQTKDRGAPATSSSAVAGESAQRSHHQHAHHSHTHALLHSHQHAHKHTRECTHNSASNQQTTPAVLVNLEQELDRDRYSSQGLQQRPSRPLDDPAKTGSSELERMARDKPPTVTLTKKRSVGSVDQFMRTPSSGSISRRRSECGRVPSESSAPSTPFETTEEAERSTLGGTGAAKPAVASGGTRPASACGSFAAADPTSGARPQRLACLSASGQSLANGRADALERELEALRLRLERRVGGVKMSKVTESYLAYFTQWAEYDPFVVQPIPSNPWCSDSTELWDSERQTKDVHCRRVRRWAFSLRELLNDPAGRDQFKRFLEKEFSAENLKFWDAVQALKRVHARDVAPRVAAIWNEYLGPDANCPINIDSKSYETSKRNMAKNRNNRCIFDEAAGHVYQLMKNDSYPRYLRSDMYKDYREASEKRRTQQQTFDVFKPQITTLKQKFNF